MNSMVRRPVRRLIARSDHTQLWTIQFRRGRSSSFCTSNYGLPEAMCQSWPGSAEVIVRKVGENPDEAAGSAAALNECAAARSYTISLRQFAYISLRSCPNCLHAAAAYLPPPAFFAAFFCAAQRFLCAAAIRSLASALRWRFFGGFCA